MAEEAIPSTSSTRPRTASEATQRRPASHAARCSSPAPSRASAPATIGSYGRSLGDGGNAALNGEERRLRRRASRLKQAMQGAAKGQLSSMLDSKARRQCGHPRPVPGASAATADRRPRRSRSVHSATTDGGSIHYLKERASAVGTTRHAVPFRWFESAAETVDRDGSRADNKSSMVGRRFAGYVAHQPARPHSADPVLSTTTEYSNSFPDFSTARHRSMVQAAETIYDRERIRNELVAFMGPDARRDATAAHLRDKYGATENQREYVWRTPEDMFNAKGVSPDIERARRDVEQTFLRIFERREQSRLAKISEALGERRAESARASPRGTSTRSPHPLRRRPRSAGPTRGRCETAQWLNRWLKTDSDEQMAEDVKLAKQKMALQKQQSHLSLQSPSSSSNPAASIAERRQPLSVPELLKITAEAEAHVNRLEMSAAAAAAALDTTRSVPAGSSDRGLPLSISDEQPLPDFGTTGLPTQQHQLLESARSLPISEQRPSDGTFLSPLTPAPQQQHLADTALQTPLTPNIGGAYTQAMVPTLAAMSLMKKPFASYECSISGASTAAPASLASARTSSSCRSHLRDRLPARPRSAGSVRAEPDCQLYTQMQENRDTPLAQLLTRTSNPSDILGTLPRGGAMSEWSARTKSAWNTLINRLDKDAIGKDKTGKGKHRSKTPKRRRPSSAVARLRTAPTEPQRVPKMTRASTAPMMERSATAPSSTIKAASGSAHHAIRRLQHSSSGPGRRHNTS